MFNPIENGTIFDMVLTLILGFILGATIITAYHRFMLDLGYDITEKRAWRKLIEYAWNSIKAVVCK